MTIDSATGLIRWVPPQEFLVRERLPVDVGLLIEAGVDRLDGVGQRAEHVLQQLRLLEDLDFSRRLKRRGRSVLVRVPLRTSGRRFLARGPWRTLAFCVWLLALYTLGGNTERYAERWRGPADRPPGSLWPRVRFESLLRRYAAREADDVRPFVVGRRVLDLGSGEGWVATALARLDLDVVVAAALADVDLDRIVGDAVARVDIATLVEQVLAEIDLTTLVTDRVDLGRVVDDVLDQIDLTALVMQRVDLAAVAERVIDDIDLPEIIRESTGSIAYETVRGIRLQSVDADRAIERVVDRILLRRRGRRTRAPEDKRAAEDGRAPEDDQP
jgi:SAM-dependent methyltransferase